MKILQINLTCNAGSTGRIMYDLNNMVISTGNDGYMLYGYSFGKTFKNSYCMNNILAYYSVRRDLLCSRITGRMGYNSVRKTKQALKWIDTIKPDIIHIHNIHGNWINVELLFDYIYENNIALVWTLHDCWPFTGRCSHFEMSNCYQWKDGCEKCPDRETYPRTYFFDFYRSMWLDKKKLFTKLKPQRVQLVTPSKWLDMYVNESFLKIYDSTIINNGIDTDTFIPLDDFKHSFDERRIILGVASSWDKFKGLNDFIKLNELIDHKEYQIVLVGVNDKQKKSLPENIIAITRTENTDSLVRLYNEAYVFVNPTYQDNYPTVNLEAISCGIPVVTYNTGGSPEMLNEVFGKVVKQGDIWGLKQAIEELDICGRFKYDAHQYAASTFNKTIKCNAYIDLYKRFVK